MNLGKVFTCTERGKALFSQNEPSTQGHDIKTIWRFTVIISNLRCYHLREWKDPKRNCHICGRYHRCTLWFGVFQSKEWAVPSEPPFHLCFRGGTFVRKNSGFSGDLKCISIGKQIQGLDSHVCEALYSIFILLYIYAKSLQLCPTLCDPMDHNLPGSSVQARILEWVAVLSSRGSSLSRDWTRVSYVSCLVGRFLYQWHHLGSPHYCFTLTHKIVYMMNRSRE